MAPSRRLPVPVFRTSGGRPHVGRLVPVVLVAGLALSGCSKKVAEDALEEEIATRLEDRGVVTPTAVDCPGDLTSKKDEQIACDVESSGGSGEAQVTVTQVDGDRVDFDINYEPDQ